jgi:hypothetical protein
MSRTTSRTAACNEDAARRTFLELSPMGLHFSFTAELVAPSYFLTLWRLNYEHGSVDLLECDTGFGFTGYSFVLHGKIEMKTCVAETSIACYYSHDFSDHQKAVLAAIEYLGETCIADLAKFLESEKSSVAARLNEIKKFYPGPIVRTGKKQSQTTGITSEHWRIREIKETLF